MYCPAEAACAYLASQFALTDDLIEVPKASMPQAAAPQPAALQPAEKSNGVVKAEQSHA